MSRGEFAFHRNQNPQIESEPVIDRSFNHGMVRGDNGIWGQMLGDEVYPLDLNITHDRILNEKLEHDYQQQKKKGDLNDTNKNTV